MLADGGFMVEKIAKLLYPDGVEVGFDGPHEQAFRATMEALQAENVTLFEATLVSNGKLARVDILKKTGKRFRLTEVKAKSYDSKEDAECRADGYANIFHTKDGGIDGDWREYLEDVTYQVSDGYFSFL